jgi:hypothetical protein
MQKILAPETMSSRRTKSRVDQQIDENLRRVYDDALNQAVPDRFLDLIERLKTADTARDPGAARDAAEKDRDDG